MDSYTSAQLNKRLNVESTPVLDFHSRGLMEARLPVANALWSSVVKCSLIVICLGKTRLSPFDAQHGLFPRKVPTARIPAPLAPSLLTTATMHPTYLFDAILRAQAGPLEVEHLARLGWSRGWLTDVNVPSRTRPVSSCSYLHVFRRFGRTVSERGYIDRADPQEQVGMGQTRQKGLREVRLDFGKVLATERVACIILFPMCRISESSRGRDKGMSTSHNTIAACAASEEFGSDPDSWTRACCRDDGLIPASTGVNDTTALGQRRWSILAKDETCTACTAHLGRGACCCALLEYIALSIENLSEASFIC